MNFIGEYSKNSTILLELLTYDEYNHPISADFPPTASIAYIDPNGLVDMEHVTLETIGTGYYLKAKIIDSDWNLGDYLVTYKATLDGKEYETRERFRLSLPSDQVRQQTPILVSDLTLLTSTNDFTTVIVNGQPVQNATVLVWSSGDNKTLVAKATTDAGGHWSVAIPPGQYTFEFVHPNGTVLRTLDKVVSAT
jgi:hypothetical protein